MLNATNYFDFYDIFVNELIGDIWLFILLGLIIIWFLTLKMNLPYQLLLLLGVLWIGIVFSTVFDTLILFWVFAILGIGVLWYYAINRSIRRG